MTMGWMGPLGVILGGLLACLGGILKSLWGKSREDQDSALEMIFLGLLVLIIGGVMAAMAR